MTNTAQPQPVTHKCPVCASSFTAKQATQPCFGPNGQMHPAARQVKI